MTHTPWAKRSEQPSGETHLLIYHLIDTANVSLLLFDKCFHDGMRSWLQRNIAPECRALIAFWAALHDIGKANPYFQQQQKANQPHGVISTFALCDKDSGLLNKELGYPLMLARQVATIVGGHHGVFPTSTVLLNVNSDATGDKSWGLCRQEMFRQLANWLKISASPQLQTISNSVAMVLAGLTSVADWIASNDQYFPYESEQLPLLEYAERSYARGETALEELRWVGKISHDKMTFENLFNNLSPRPLQKKVIEISQQLDGSEGIMIIEAPMGEGKTEAAMYLADRWGLSLGQRGCYFALPTQATSNQMFGRVKDFICRRYSNDDRINLMLLHGHASLSAEFQNLMERGEDFIPRNVGAESKAYDGANINVVAGEWFTYRKRGLLAPYGVGTIDQALLAVLQTKHVFVRLFGLAHKTIIIDEVHAYDTYMTTLLERLLEWLAALECPVVLLSATLPGNKRRDLLEAYNKGLATHATQSTSSVNYPRISWLTNKTQGEASFAVAQETSKAVTINWINGGIPTDGSAFELGSKLREVLAGGGCAAVICNTVNRAQEIYTALKPYFLESELDLFHARFLFGERDQREKHALIKFGKDGTVVECEGKANKVTRPFRAVLVATQVIEQSLDLDFDLMVTDFAPTDLILQRAGRLHRHQRTRPTGLCAPVLWVCKPDMDNSVPRFDKGTEYVYEPYVLLRSWLSLEEGFKDCIKIPDEVEGLIESTYGKRPHVGSLKIKLDETLTEFEVQHDNEEQEARERYIKRPVAFTGELWKITSDPREEDSPELHAKHQALTRLAPPSVNVVFLTKPIDDNKMPTLNEAKQYLMRSVSIAHRGIVHALLGLDTLTAWKQSALLRNHKLVVLDENQAQVNRYSVKVDKELGVVIRGNGREA